MLWILCSQSKQKSPFAGPEPVSSCTAIRLWLCFARKLKQSYKLQGSAGNITSHPKEVLKIFSLFYQKLLADPPAVAGSIPQSWLDTLPLPVLTDEQLHFLNALCTEENYLLPKTL